MHNWMPKQAAAAKLKLDDALMDLIAAKRQIRMSSDPGLQEQVVQRAIKHIEAAIGELT